MGSSGKANQIRACSVEKVKEKKKNQDTRHKKNPA